MEFQKKSIEEVAAMTADAQTAYLKEKEAFESEMKLKEIKKVSDLEAKTSDLEAKLKASQEEAIKQGTAIEKLKEVKSAPIEQKSSIEQVFEKNAESLKAISLKSNDAKSVKFEVKATATYGDIDSGLDFAPMRAGITDIPKKKTVFVDLFRRINFNGEFYKYAEQETVTRNAQNVATCTSVTSTTGETIKTQNIATKKIKDTLKFCSDYANDYPFVQGRLQTLINDSVLFRLDQQILLGSAAGEELNSIDSVSSEFSAANVDAPIGATVKDANFVDLLGAMQTQIFVLGKENSYSPDTAVVNVLDWFKFVNSYKDGDNNYMNYRMTTVDGVPMVNGMKIITSPEVAANTCYVFDSTRGELLVNQSYETSIAFENDTDWENDLVALKASLRANLLVEANNANAFMKCSDVATGISAITEV
jgi:HK97 family phage major capsid protein